MNKTGKMFSVCLYHRKITLNTRPTWLNNSGKLDIGKGTVFLAFAYLYLGLRVVYQQNMQLKLFNRIPYGTSLILSGLFLLSVSFVPRGTYYLDLLDTILIS